MWLTEVSTNSAEPDVMHLCTKEANQDSPHVPLVQHIGEVITKNAECLPLNFFPDSMSHSDFSAFP